MICTFDLGYIDRPAQGLSLICLKEEAEEGVHFESLASLSNFNGLESNDDYLNPSLIEQPLVEDSSENLVRGAENYSTNEGGNLPLEENENGTTEKVDFETIQTPIFKNIPTPVEGGDQVDVSFSEDKIDNRLNDRVNFDAENIQSLVKNPTVNPLIKYHTSPPNIQNIKRFRVKKK